MKGMMVLVVVITMPVVILVISIVADIGCGDTAAVGSDTDVNGGDADVGLFMLMYFALLTSVVVLLIPLMVMHAIVVDVAGQVYIKRKLLIAVALMMLMVLNLNPEMPIMAMPLSMMKEILRVLMFFMLVWQGCWFAGIMLMCVLVKYLVTKCLRRWLCLWANWSCC
ncbi:hypothetical protein DPMN_158185 [Dreissena polymorpha]|uniref:Uncharacterized protein n=1 Tax=Dreissena polymorpha TaxID=45954 RepID=A0A9D4EHE6_DREPO|nr:hypothetical protein DPMN_158185 [Dreissena polymorpha]